MAASPGARLALLLTIPLTALTLSLPVFADEDPLPSWNQGAAKQAIVEFVQAVTDQSQAVYVEPQDRIVVFDNDGTLWPSHPVYTQLAFALDRIDALAPAHPDWKNKQPFKAALDKDFNALGQLGSKGILELVMASHTGMSTTEFETIVKDWFASARHPRFKRRYTELAYLPMLELLNYLRSHGFKTYIVSGGGTDFIRPISQTVYGIPPEQVVGSSVKIKYEIENGKPRLLRLSELNFVDDKAGKPIGIHNFIGKRPLAAFGNSDGDREMLQWTAAGKGARLMMLVLHDDPKREYAYGPARGLPDTQFGSFSKELMREAEESGWIVISMKNDWKTIFVLEQ
ncbi:HAD family hydrolase [Microbulbifer sp. 2201CG32-9]|uniref:HAD family hydrolase n=1 Tax=Microbulbifer sp. 2201CG32-9 TaxID=3232309 RepID=UPI00345B8E7C